MPEKTYFLRFAHSDSSEIEEQEYTRLADAWEAFRMFAEPDSAEMYTRIELTEYTWKTQEDTLLAAMEFAAAD